MSIGAVSTDGCWLMLSWQMDFDRCSLKDDKLSWWMQSQRHVADLIDAVWKTRRWPQANSKELTLISDSKVCTCSLRCSPSCVMYAVNLRFLSDNSVICFCDERFCRSASIYFAYAFAQPWRQAATQRVCQRRVLWNKSDLCSCDKNSCRSACQIHQGKQFRARVPVECIWHTHVDRFQRIQHVRIWYTHIL